MQRIEATAQGRLVIDDRPWLLAIGSAVAIVVLLGIAWRLLDSDDPFDAWLPLAALVFPGGLYLITERTTLVLDAATGVVTLRKRGFRGTRLRHWPAATLRGAQVQRMVVPRQADSFRLVLVLAADDGSEGAVRTVPFLDTGGIEAEAVRAAQAVNDWIAAQGDTAA